MEKPIKILYIDDNRLDRELVSDALTNKSGEFQVVEAASRIQFEKYFALGGYDLVLSDFNILGFEGLQVMDTIHEKSPDIPVIIVTGTGSEEVAVKAIKKGAADYVIKTTGHIRRLPHTIKAALDMKRMEQERRRVEKALSEAYNIINRSPAVAFLWKNEAGWPVDFVSENVEKLFGYSDKEFLERKISYSEIIHSSDLKTVMAEVSVYSKKMEQKTFTHKPYRIITKNGNIKWIEDITYIRRDSNGKITYYEGIVYDITQRKLAEQALRKSQEYSRNLIDSSLDMIIAVDKQRKIMEFNSAAEETFGYNKEEVLGKHINLLYADDEEGRLVHLQTVEKGHLVQEILNKRKCGEIFPALLAASVLVDDKGNLTGVMGVSRDISEQKASERALRESEKKFRTLFDDSRDAIYISSMNGFFIDFNASMEEMLGYNREELLALSKEELYTGKNNHSKFLKEIEKRGFVKDYELSLKKKNGTVIFCLETTSLRKDKKGNIINYQGIIRDITKRKQAQKKLLEALEKAKQAERVKTLFLANMSHEIRTPLNGILGFTDLIESSTCHLLSEEEKEFFAMVKNCGQRLMCTVHEILDISQIEAGTYNLKVEVFDLCKLVKDITRECRLMATNKGLKLEFLPCANPAYIRADQYGVAQAIRNIIDNAIKYTELGKITIMLKQEAQCFFLSIQDSGIGIAEEYRDYLFEAFTQESEGYTKKFQGIGLGMAITKRHLDLNQVDITFNSTKGVGTIFTLTFKSAKKPLPEKQIKEKPFVTTVSEPINKPLVLLVEDDPGSQKLTDFFLRERYNTYFAVSVNGAKKQLAEHRVDLILLDLSLVGSEDGLDLARFLRKTEKWQHIPIIALTAHAFTTDRDNCLAAGCNDYLAKPIKKEKLLLKINELL